LIHTIICIPLVLDYSCWHALKPLCPAYVIHASSVTVDLISRTSLSHCTAFMIPGCLPSSVGSCLASSYHLYSLSIDFVIFLTPQKVTCVSYTVFDWIATPAIIHVSLLITSLLVGGQPSLKRVFRSLFLLANFCL
jgi:hypothetical protein